jgi:hypothetical protein
VVKSLLSKVETEVTALPEREIACEAFEIEPVLAASA